MLCDECIEGALYKKVLFVYTYIYYTPRTHTNNYTHRHTLEHKVLWGECILGAI